MRAKSDGNLRAIFRSFLPEAQWTPIETGATTQGVPDSEYCFPGGRQGHVEFKRTLAWAVSFRVEQVGWLLRRHRLGGRAFVAVRRISAGADELYVVSAEHVVLLSTSGLRAVPHATVQHDGPDAWNWTEVRAVLRGG